MVVAVMVAVPSATAVTFPWTGVTVAMAVSVDANCTDLSSASEGKTVADRVSVAPTSRDNVVLFNVTPEGAMLLGRF